MSACICEPPTNPTIIGDFADTGGTLKCGGQNSCQSPAASTSGTFFKMREPFILECSGQNSCDKDFDVENVGSMCVTGDNAVGPNQQTGTFRLADADPDTGRINDVCCARPFRQTTGGGRGRINPTAHRQRSRTSAACIAPVIIRVTTFRSLFQANLGCNSGC